MLITAMPALYPMRACPHSDVAAPTRQPELAPAPPYGPATSTRKELCMLWLVIGIVLLIVAIAGGAIVHPLLFVLAILALLLFFVGGRGRTAL
jgi:hypothetical protein